MDPFTEAYARFLRRQVAFLQEQLREVESQGAEECKSSAVRVLASPSPAVPDGLEINADQDEAQISRILDRSLLQRCDAVLGELDQYRRELQDSLECEQENERPPPRQLLQPISSMPRDPLHPVEKSVPGAPSRPPRPADGKTGGPPRMREPEPSVALYNEYSMASHDYLKRYGLISGGLAGPAQSRARGGAAVDSGGKRDAPGERLLARLDRVLL